MIATLEYRLIVADERAGQVIMTTLFGGQRIVDPLVGEQLPRIC